MPSASSLCLLSALFVSASHLGAADAAAGPPPVPRLSFLDNGTLRLGVDLNRGGAIAFLSRGGSGNAINTFDLGRYCQMSFFSGPVPFAPEGKHPAKHWQHIGWNPVQAGDDFNHGSKVIAHRNDGRMIYVKCVPLQWPLDGVAAESTLESWLELDGTAVKFKGRLNNARSDKTQYPARHQELPALYGNAAFQRVVTYAGDSPFTGAPVADAPRPGGKHPWAFWQATEGWSALLDRKDFGLGLISPGRISFTGGFAGTPGPNDSMANSTGYLASLGDEILDHNVQFEYRCDLVLGSLNEIRGRALAYRRTAPPAWKFATDRQGWHYRNATDQGWPVSGALDIALNQPDPQLISPATFWQAEDAPTLLIEGAFKSSHHRATVYWQRHGQNAPAENDRTDFEIVPDGEFRRYTVRLADAASYKGAIIRLRLDPVPAGAPGDWLKIRSITLQKSPLAPG